MIGRFLSNKVNQDTVFRLTIDIPMVRYEFGSMEHNWFSAIRLYDQVFDGQSIILTQYYHLK